LSTSETANISVVFETGQSTMIALWPTINVRPLLRLSMSSAPTDVERSPRSATDNGSNKTIKLVKLTTTTPTPRSVSFFVDKLDRDLVDVIEYELPPIEQWSDLYWSQEDKNEFLQDARNYVADFTERYSVRVQRLEQVFTNGTNGNLSHDDYQSDLQTIIKWTNSDARGFEDSTTSYFWDKRCKDIEQILGYYDYLKETFPSGVYIDEKLRRYSERRSQCAREFAFKLAMGDALAK
jgi:hypothetical protein